MHPCMDMHYALKRRYERLSVGGFRRIEVDQIKYYAAVIRQDLRYM